ncbi:MAG: nitroreductase family protein [Candidatus Aminicenantales bacterium]
MTLYDLILSRRSIRQFLAKPISKKILKKLVNAARLAPSAANLQPLEFVAINRKELNKAIFSCLRWAAYISPEGNPKPGSEPTAYIVVLVNTKIRDKGFERDSGAAMENMILAAWEEGIGSCWVISIDRSRIHHLLNIPEEYKVDSILALGYPAEKPVIEEIKDSVKYWKDEQGQLHVPKRKLEEVFHFNKF